MSYTEKAGAVQSFRIGEVFSLGLSILRKEFAVIMGMSTLFYVPMLFFTVIGLNRMGQGDVGGGVAISLVGLIVQIVFIFILTAALTYATMRSLQGRDVTFGAALQQGLGRLLPVVGVSLVGGMAIALGFMLLVIPGLIIATLFYVVVPAVVVERRGVFESLGRSADLTKGHRWKVFGVIVLLFLFNMALQYIVGLIAPGYQFTPETRVIVPEFSVLNLILTSAVGIVVYALGAIFPAVTYYKLRVAKEGLDVDQIASVFD